MALLEIPRFVPAWMVGFLVSSGLIGYAEHTDNLEATILGCILFGVMLWVGSDSRKDKK